MKVELKVLKCKYLTAGTVCVCVHACEHGAQSIDSCVIPQELSTLSFVILPTRLELTEYPRLAAQRVPLNSLNLPPLLWDYNHRPPYVTFVCDPKPSYLNSEILNH